MNFFNQYKDLFEVGNVTVKINLDWFYSKPEASARQLTFHRPTLYIDVYSRA